MYSRKNLVIILMMVLGIIILIAGCESLYPPTPSTNTYIIISAAGHGGTINPPGEITVDEGSSKNFVISPDEGYEIYDVLVDGVSVGVVEDYLFTNIQKNHSIVANFISKDEQGSSHLQMYTITATATTGGTIQPEGAVTVIMGGTQVFTITEDVGYEIVDVLVDGASVGAVSYYIFDNVKNNHIIEAIFVQMFTLTMAISGKGSTIPAVGTYVYEAGTVVDLTANPYLGCYSFTSWSGSLISDVNPTTITMDSNKAVTANFELGLKKVINVTTDIQYDTIQAAIDDADVGIIYVCPGIYNENLEFDSKNLSVQSANPSDPEVVATTIIQGSGSGSVVQFLNGDTSHLAGFTIRGGSAMKGGGIYIEESSPHIEVNVITDNTANQGGGIYIYDNSNPLIGGNTITGNTGTITSGGIEVYANSAPLIVNNIISNNRGDIGGGMKVDSGSSPTINLNTIIGNSASDDGGGIHISYSDDSIISNNTIIGNTSDHYGGGLHVAYNSPDISGNTIRDNLAIEGGGGIYLYDSSSVLIENTISGNTSQSTGGGIWIDESGYPNISSNDITNNDAPHGGGIYVSESTPYINDNNIESNSAVWGAGIGSFDSYLQVTNNDFINNMALNYGGGIYVYILSNGDLTPYDPRPTGWGNSGDGDYRQNIPTMMLDPADGVEYFIADNKFLGNKHENSGSGYQYSEGAHVYFDY